MPCICCMHGHAQIHAGSDATAHLMIASCFMQARATDTTLSTLISAGAEDIASGQAKVVALLQSIIGQQNSAAAAAEDAAEALAAIQNLQSQQAAAQQAIALSLTNSISAIQVGSACLCFACTSSTSWRQPLLEAASAL